MSIMNSGNEITPHQFRSTFLKEMAERGLLRQCTDFDALDKELADTSVTAYVGFDATADGLHVGHLMSLVSMKRLAAAGHRVIALVGGGTTLLGDPSFRNSTRPMLSEEQVAANIAGIRADIEAVLGPSRKELVFVDNKEWLGPARFLDFMRDVGAHFSVSRMLSMESVQSRLGQQQSLTMMEFSYMMLQAADFVELSKRYGCTLQMGGSDQWGNIVNGIELGRRTGGLALFGLTTPLLTTASGEKMGKTAGGAVWLSAAKLPDFDFWQFWRNVPDADLKKCMLAFTDVPTAEIEALNLDDPARLNEAKKRLADDVTKLVRGEGASVSARRQAEAMFEGGGSLVTHELPSGTLSVADLVVSIGFASSKSEARRLVEGGGVKVDGLAVADALGKFTTNAGDTRAVAVGKKRRAVVLFS